MKEECFALVQKLDTDPALIIQGQGAYYLSDIARDQTTGAFYKVLKTGIDAEGIDASLFLLAIRNTLLKAKVVKILDAKDGEIKWEILN